ncbi:hypothetical protein BJV74DRAFT_986617 [Russula compacta]|nr:hypothetical protein BJV74DRAFT_986617 [Russula compacta]
MSSTLQLSPSFSQFQDIIDTALKDYANKTGKDIPTDQITARLLTCNSPDDVLEVLQEQAHAFNQYRNGDWKVQLIRRLKPTVDILLGLSTSGVFGQSIGLKFPPAQAIFAGVGLLLAAAKGVSTSYDALIDLFECFEHYLARLKGFTDIPATVSGILVKIMVELLAVLALATQQIKQGRFKKFAKKLLGENDIEAVLQRLDRLTMEESRMTAAQTMEVVYGLFNNLKVVMDDGKASIDNIREALVRMQQISEDLNKMKRNQLQEKIQKWLSPPDPSINHNTTCEAHHNGTTSWFLEGSIYHEWKTNGSLIWAHGKRMVVHTLPVSAADGLLCRSRIRQKRALLTLESSSSIINDIERTCATGLASVVYHYFDFKDARKQDRRGFLCSLLNQLCTLSHHGYDTLSSLHKAYGNGLRQPSEDDLIKCLKNAWNSLPTGKGLGLVNELVDLRHPDIRICVTSRPEVDIQTALEPLASYSLSLHDERGQRNDIINYVKSVVDSDARMRKWRAEDRQLVIDSLSQKADGM